MSLVEEMRGRGAGKLGVSSSAAMGMSAGTLDGGMGGSGLTRDAVVVRAGIGGGTSLVQGYLAGAIKYRN